MAAKFVKPTLITLGIIVLLGGVLAWHIYAVTHKKLAAAPTASSTPAATHSSDEAVKAADDLYQHYLPLKNQVVAQVGDNPMVEPALVQAVRGSEQYLGEDFYNHILEDYMTEYRDTGKVTKDDIACVSTPTTGSTAALASAGKDDAIVNVTLKFSTGTTKVVPVTISLHTLKALKINCTG